MYIDIIVVLILLGIIWFFFREFSAIIYGFAIIDIGLRVLTGIKLNIPLADIAGVIDNYIPESILNIVAHYLTGTLYTIFVWCYIILYIIFLTYIIRTFWKKKR